MPMPIPPPPEVALTITGKPKSAEAAIASSGVSKGPPPGSTGNPAASNALRAATLSPEQLQDLRGRPDEDEAGVGAGPREHRVLREEAVPGMDRLRAGLSAASTTAAGFR